MRDGRLTISLVFDGGMAELLTHARPLPGAPVEPNLTAFEAKLETARFHKAPYAEVTAGMTFALRDAEAVLARWRRQIDALRAAK